MLDINILKSSFKLPCGETIPNRMVKSAMSENMASKGGKPNERLYRLYEKWGQENIGIIISGNVMIDSRAIGEKRNVVAEDYETLSALSEWSERTQKHGAHLWMQVNHPGRQAPKFNKELVSSSDIGLSGPILKPYFGKPRSLKENEIWDIIERFGTTAEIAKKAKWKGVQIHGAHGYLVSQFLSPLCNVRTDKWGGNLENRARFVLEIYKNIRSKVGSDYPIGIKLNSADFQRGGFTEEESLSVIDMLSAEGIDMIEVSGGTYERPSMMGIEQKESTRKREAYFSDFIIKARQKTKTPLLLTGGFRSSDIMAAAIQNDELDFIGLARPLAIEPELITKYFNHSITKWTDPKVKTGIKLLDASSAMELPWYQLQMERIGKGKAPNENLSAYKALFKFMKDMPLF